MTALMKRVLVVEDNDLDAKLIERCFRKNNIGGELIVKPDGAQAVDYIDSLCPSEELHLVFLDLKLPFKDGTEVLQHIRKNEHLDGVPVVMFSSTDNEEEIRRCYRLGASGFVRKPEDYQQYMSDVCITAQYWLAAGAQDEERRKNSHV